MANLANLTIDQGTTFTANIFLETTTGSPWNLIGWSVRGQIRKSYNSDDATATFTATSNGKGGKITISLTSVQTAAIKKGDYLYDIEIYQGDPETVHRVVEGKIKVYPEVTK
jgi:hypothetical protein